MMLRFKPSVGHLAQLCFGNTALCGRGLLCAVPL